MMLTTSQNTTISLQLTEIINNAETIQNENEYNQPQNTKNYKIGDMILFNKSKQGLIRYIGPLHNDSNQWFGIEVIGGSKGFHDGSFQGHRYFACGAHQGIFLKKHQIIRPLIASDFGLDKIKSVKRNKSPKIKKLGPRDIGRIKGWKPSREQ